MTDRKISPELHLAMELPEETRKKSLDLNVGYSARFEEWELIIRYTGSLESVRQLPGVSVEELSGGYAVIRIPQYLIGKLSEDPVIDYIEKPKSLLVEEMEGITISCIRRVRLPDYGLTGAGTLVACLDSGVDIYHPDFRNLDGTTRIVTLWDQTVPGNPPEGFTIGSEYSKEEIDAALRMGETGKELVPEYDASGHGTAVLGIMAGNGNASGGRNEGVAPQAEILVVKLGNPMDRGFPRTTQLMLAIEYAVRYANRVRKPVAINISYGNNYGAHSGNTILERYMDTIANSVRGNILTGTGNDGTTARHAEGRVRPGQEEIIELYAGGYLDAFNLQIWKQYQDEFEIWIESPDQYRIGPLSPYAAVQSFRLPDTEISVYYSEPTPYNPEQEIYIAWIPTGAYVTEGIWKIILRPKRVINGTYRMWLPVAGSTTAEVSFVQPYLFNTLVVPSTAKNVITVAAYDSIRNTYAPFSGRGENREGEFPAVYGKPDLCAPGVEINSCVPGGGYGSFTGTSFAVPFVSGAAALLMEYGIVQERDPYLYGEKVRANLIKGARKLSFQQTQPSPLVGWGALCVAKSLPIHS